MEIPGHIRALKNLNLLSIWFRTQNIPQKITMSFIFFPMRLVYLREHLKGRAFSLGHQLADTLVFLPFHWWKSMESMWFFLEKVRRDSLKKRKEGCMLLLFFFLSSFFIKCFFLSGLNFEQILVHFEINEKNNFVDRHVNKNVMMKRSHPIQCLHQLNNVQNPWLTFQIGENDGILTMMAN